MSRWKQAAKWGWGVGLVGLWALRLNLFVTVSDSSHRAPFQGDFAVYLAAARVLRLNPHANIYDVSVLLPYGCGLLSTTHTPYVYPPLLAMLLQLFALLSCGIALPIWQSINLALWLVVVVVLLRYLPRHRLLLLPLGLFFVPLWTSFYFGQINEAILLGIIAALWLVERHHPRWAGVVLGVLAAIKLFPVLLVLYFILRRQWMVGVTAILTILVSGLMMGVVVGLSGLDDAARAILTFRALTDHHPNNIALLPLSPIVPPLLVALVLLFLVAIIRYQDGDQRLGYAWALATMILILPLIWEHYFVWLLPVFAYLLSRPLPSHRRMVPILLALIYLPLAVVQTPTPWLTACVIPLVGIAGWTFLHSSATASQDLAWMRGQFAYGVRTVRERAAYVLR